MPPASLSTLAVMMPGPTTARTAAMRAQRDLARRVTPPAGVGRACTSTMQDLLEHVVDGYHPEDAAVLFHRQREEVVLGGQLGDAGRRVVGRERRGMWVHQRVHRHLRRGQQQIAQRD